MNQRHPSRPKSTFWERGGAWVVVQGIIMLGVLSLAFRFHSNHRNFGLLAAGFVLMGAGGATGIAGAWALRKSLTPFPKPLPQAQLVRSGIYSRIRHPLYTSVIFGSIGWALAWQSWPALLLACGLIPFFMAKARHEEHFLLEQFPDYDNYAKSTNRFFPGLPKGF